MIQISTIHPPTQKIAFKLNEKSNKQNLVELIILDSGDKLALVQFIPTRVPYLYCHVL